MEFLAVECLPVCRTKVGFMVYFCELLLARKDEVEENGEEDWGLMKGDIESE